MKYKVTLNGKIYEVEVDETSAYVANTVEAPTAPAAPAALAPAAPAESLASAPAPQKAVSADGLKVTAPMPGIILSVPVSEGSFVKVGDVLVVLEDMKMENEIVAPSDGTVKQVLAQKGSTVNTDEVLLVIA